VCHPWDFFTIGPDITALLEKIDVDLAQRCQALGCSCGATLHVANYPRKIFRLCAVVLAVRFSFCCSRCRKRNTPASVRFFGRRRFHSPVFLLLSAVSGRRTHAHLGELYALFEIDARTVRRWRKWWREHFAATAFWRRARGRLRPPAPSARELPLGLLERFAHRAGEMIVAVLCFLSPLTTTSCRPPDLLAG
jgi:hypothetical protein